ncbi:adenylate/guanylate cyclase domain-containing protein [Methylobacterium sp. WSM2598]|uniref:adenylate/guanylate cyclase domain-containing protein n=1 Tax=Methylobacterium sp. WSM2598 TaxID=398261 RepID=UPI0003A8851B|nr:adenylate/guanylate cyclase domain-containing protein [Methylobacterium sp. WSM2598]
MDKAVERRLAAILVADLVGYSRLVGVDETGTLRRLKELRRELIEPRIAAARGRVVKSTGDGLIVEFPSPVRAVLCAVAIQHAMLVRDDSVVPDKALRLRIGINLGDVVAEPDGDLYGDGVNVAARLEPLAEPGGICISRSVYEQVRDKLRYPFEDRGKQELKNIARPVGVYALGPGVIVGLGDEQELLDAAPGRAAGGRWRTGTAVAAGVVALLGVGGLGWWTWRSPPAPTPAQTLAAQMIGEARPAPRLSMVLLPFTNLSSDPEQDYFADGLTEDLTTDLSHLDGSFVIARNTAFTYKGKSVDVKQLGRDLGVRYVLEGSVRRTVDRVIVNAQLISAETRAHIWADRFEGEWSRLGELQAEFVARLARSLDVALTHAESLRSLRERPNNPDAADLTFRGWAALNRPRSPSNTVEAIGLFEQALQLDPHSPKAVIGLARGLAIRARAGWSSDSAADANRIDELLTPILSVSPNNAMAHWSKGQALAFRKQFDRAILELDAAIASDPNFADAHAFAGLLRIFAGRSMESFPYFDKAIRLSPKDPTLHNFLFDICHAHSHLANWDEAIKWCSKSLAVAPYYMAYIDLATAYAWTGRTVEAKEAVEGLLKISPGYTVKKWANADWSNNPTFIAEYKRMVEGLRRSGLPEN